MKTIKQLLITIAVLLCSTTMYAYDFEVDGIYYNIISTTDLTVKVTNGDNKYSGEIIIPSTITYLSRTLKIVAIGDEAFYYCDSLANIIIPSTVTSIGESAFNGCRSLTNITIPNSVTTIEDYAFNGCTSLTDLCIEDSEIPLSLGYNQKGHYYYGYYINGEGLFIDCPLEELYLGRNLSYETEEDYGYSPFYNKTTLTSVTIGNNVTNIGQYAFSGCSGLTNITIPNSVTIINNRAFLLCTSLKELHIEDGDTILELGYNLMSFDVESDSKGLFYDCPLEKIHLGRNVNYMIYEDHCYYGNSPFYNRKDLKTLTISNSVTEIRGNAFEGCSSLSEIIIPNSVQSIGYDAFQGCTCLKSVIIGNNVTIIGNDAFNGCAGLISITIPNNVTVIGFNTFSNCGSLKEICVEDGYSTLCWGNYSTYDHGYFEGCPIEKVYLGRNFSFDGDEGGLFTGTIAINSLTIGNCVTRIYDEVFCNFTQNVNIYLMCANPPTINNRSDAAYVNWNIYVPKGTLNVYQNANVWKNFWNIQEHNLVEYYTVTFVVDNEVYKTQLVAKGDIIPEIDEPTKEGYTFSGWSNIPEIMPAHDVTITGSFSINSYDLVYMIDGEEYKRVTLEFGSEIIPEEEPVKEGHTFSGWSEIPETMPAEDVIVTGSFSINSYDLVYLVDDEEYKRITLEFGSEIIPEEEPVKEGYTFSGWSEIPETMPSHDVEVTGSFIPTNVSEIIAEVSLQVNGNSISLSNANNSTVAIYSINGVLVKRIDKYTGEEITLDKGIYIVCVGDKTMKIIL